MDSNDHTNRSESIDRRTLLYATGTIASSVAFAGCTGGGTTTKGGDCDVPENLAQAVPDVYEGSTSQGGIKRKPDRLIPRSKVDYQREPNGNQQCSKCKLYVPDKNGDCVGACVRIKGMVVPDGYCDYYLTQVGGGW